MSTNYNFNYGSVLDQERTKMCIKTMVKKIAQPIKVCIEQKHDIYGYHTFRKHSFSVPYSIKTIHNAFHIYHP